MADVTYPPLDVLKPAAENIWVVDSGPMKAMGVIPIPVRTTVIRLSTGETMIHSPSRLTPELRRQIDPDLPPAMLAHLVLRPPSHQRALKTLDYSATAIHERAAQGRNDMEFMLARLKAAPQDEPLAIVTLPER